MKNKLLITITFTLIILVLILTQYQSVSNKYHLGGDTSSMFTVHHFPEGLEDNIFVQYFATKTGSKIPLINFYAFINQFTDFIIFTKLVAIALFLISLVYIYKLGKLILNQRYALILTILFALHAWAQLPFIGGISKSFAVPGIIAFLYYLIKKNQLKLSITTVILAAFYPPIWLVALGIFGLSKINILKKKLVELDLRKNWLFYFSIIISVGLILLTMFFNNYGFTEPVTFKEALNSPDFYLGGRIPLFKAVEPVISNPIDIFKTAVYLYNIGIKTPIKTDPVFMLIILTSLFATIYWKTYKKKMSLPKEIYFLAISAFIFQIIASLVLFNLYFPIKYVMIPIPLFLMILLSKGLYSLSLSKKRKYFFSLIIFLLVIFYIPQIYNEGKTTCPDKEIYNFIKELPKGTTFASHPDDADCIAIFSGMMPFVTMETAVPYDHNYYNIVRKRTFDFFSAYYAEDEDNVLEFCEKNDIDYFVINEEHFTPNYLDKKLIYFNPFSDHIKNITKQMKNQKEKFYLIDPEGVLFENKKMLVMKCSQRTELFLEPKIMPPLTILNKWPLVMN